MLLSPANEEEEIPNFFRYVPNRRNKRWKWFSRAVYFFLTAVAIGLTVGLGIDEEIKYKLTPRIKAGLTLGISLIIAILVNGIKRIILFLEEIGQKKDRYDGSWKNMFAASCSKLHGGIILFFIVIAFVATIPAIYYKYASPWISILSAIGVGPLLVQLFHFDKCSNAEVSAIIEENRKGTGHTLAVDYHLQHLHSWLPERPEDKNTFKRYILIPSDWDTTKTMNIVDGRIKKDGNIVFYTGNESLKRFAQYSTYSINKVGENHSTFTNVLLVYATPLNTLYNMSLFESVVGFIKVNEIIYETKMFYGTLNIIISNCQECRQNNVLVPYDLSELEERGEALGDLLSQKLSHHTSSPTEDLGVQCTDAVTGVETEDLGNAENIEMEPSSNPIEL